MARISIIIINSDFYRFFSLGYKVKHKGEAITKIRAHMRWQLSTAQFR
jgi:hypothetical protein